MLSLATIFGTIAAAAATLTVTAVAPHLASDLPDSVKSIASVQYVAIGFMLPVVTLLLAAGVAVCRVACGVERAHAEWSEIIAALGANGKLFFFFQSCMTEFFSNLIRLLLYIRRR